MICATFGDQCSKALSVVQCESNFNPGVVGAAGERGLFQIHPVHIQYLAPFGGWDAMFDPAANIAYAHNLYSQQGWGPWTCA
jgi:soluble lytic murein transglycosylase-like protein